MRTQLFPGHTLGALLFAGILSLNQNAANATVRDWSGGATMDPTWSNPNNWANGVPVAGDGLFFPAGGGHQNNSDNLAAGTTFSSLGFGGGSPPNYTLSGNSFALFSFFIVI